MTNKSKILIIMLILLGVCFKAQSVSASSALVYQRTDMHEVASKEYYINDTKTDLVQLKGSKQRTERINKEPLSQYAGEVWVSQYKTTLNTDGVSIDYINVINESNGVTGWVPEYLLHEVGSIKVGTLMNTPDSNYQVYSPVSTYNLIRSDSTQKLQIDGVLHPGQVYDQVAIQMNDSNGHLAIYSLLKNISGSVVGWARTDRLTAVPFGTATYTGSRNGVSNFATAGSVLITPKNSTALNLVGNETYTSKKVVCQPSAQYLQTNGLQNYPDSVKRSKGYLDSYHFKTSMYLPENYGSRDLGNPQSATFSGNDQYLYVMYVDIRQRPDVNQTGWIVRYDWRKLSQIGATTPGHMKIIRQATNDFMKNPHHLSKLDTEVLSCIKVGPKFISGHVESLALNPKTNEMWFTRVHGTTNPHFAVRVNPDTLTPNATVQFNMADTALGSPLSFDNQGNAYTWTRVGDYAQIYRGVIGIHNVHFEEMKQKLVVGDALAAQSMGYNFNNGRLYLVADENIVSIPANSFNEMQSSQIGENVFNGTREFEGLVFMHNSNEGFLLTNRGVEMMQMVD